MPDTLPLLPEVMAMNEELFEVNHVHPVCVVTLTLPVNAPALIEVVLGEIEKEQAKGLGLGVGDGPGRVTALAVLE